MHLSSEWNIKWQSERTRNPLTTGRKHEGMFISSVEQKHTLQSFGCQKIKLFATFEYVTAQTIRVEKIYSHASLSTFSMFVFIGLLAIIIKMVPTKKNKYFFCFLHLQNVNNSIEFYSFGWFSVRLMVKWMVYNITHTTDNILSYGDE